MATEDVGLKIAVDISGALKSLNGFAAESNKSLKSVESSFNSLNTVAKAALAFLGTRQVVRAFDSITTAAAESEAAITKMEVALKLAGDYTESAARGFESFASQMQASTTYTDEAILKSVALSKQFGATNAQTQKMVQAGADLASITGGSLDEAVSSLGKTLDGTAGRLAEQIPALRNMTAAQLQAGAAIDYVAQRFKGASQAAAGTYSGSIIRAKNAFDDLLETLGGYITNNVYVLAAINKSTALFQDFGKILKENEATLRQMAKGGVLLLVNGFAILLQTVEYFDKAITKLLDAFRAVFRLFGTFPTALLRSITDIDLTPLKELNDQLHKESKDSLKPLEERVKIVDSLTDAILKYSDAVEKAGDQQVLSSRKASDAIRNQLKAIERLSSSQREQFLGALSQNPVGGVFKDANGDQQVASPNAKARTGLERTLGVVGGSILLISKGTEGAVKAASGLVGALANTLLPGIGALAGQVFEVFAQGPEKVKEFVDQFVSAIPVIIRNVILAIPAFITELVRKAPDLINALIDGIPDIIDAFIAQLPDLISALIEAMPKIIVAMELAAPKVMIAMASSAPKVIAEMVRNIPTFMSEFLKAFLTIPEQFVKGLMDALGKAFSSAGGLGGGGGGGIAGSLLGYAFGGVGGAVIGGTAGGVAEFFGFRAGDYSGARVGGLRSPQSQALAASSARSSAASVPSVSGTAQEQQMVIKVVVGEQELAKTMLRLNRNGFRLAT